MPLREQQPPPNSHEETSEVHLSLLITARTFVLTLSRTFSCVVTKRLSLEPVTIHLDRHLEYGDPGVTRFFRVSNWRRALISSYDGIAHLTLV